MIVLALHSPPPSSPSPSILPSLLSAVEDRDVKRNRQKSNDLHESHTDGWMNEHHLFICRKCKGRDDLFC
jgi:hypothetical protein